MYNIPHGAPKWGEIRFFGDYCPKCGTFNSDFNKNSIIMENSVIKSGARIGGTGFGFEMKTKQKKHKAF